VPVATQIQDFISRASWIRRMFEEGNEMKAKYGADNVHDFTLGNPVMEPPVQLVEKLREVAADPAAGQHRYMPNAGYPWVRDKVAEVLAEESGVAIGGGNVIMTVGAACAVNVTLKVILEPGDEVLVLSPYFVEYVFYADNHGGKVKLVETDDEFQPDLAAIEAAIGPKTRAIILNNPNNPTGAVYPRAVLEELAELLERAGERIGHPIYVISDEPYRKIAYDAEVVPSLSVFRNAILCTSHSKDLALPGERIGYLAVHPEAEDAAELLGAMTFAIRTLGFVNAPALMQRVVADLQRVTVDLQQYRELRDLLYAGLVDAGYECVRPEGAFYMFPKSPLPDDVAFIRKLQEERILAVPGSGFGRPGYFRLSYCVDAELIVKALPGLRRVRESC
jgi:aspartate aminotransferase